MERLWWPDPMQRANANQRRDGYAARFELTETQRRHLTEVEMDQLDRCKDDATRRILLGKSA
jgi:hypothetical protein